MSILAENWHTECLEDADSYSVLSFLNLQPEIYFWANLDRKSIKLLVLHENQHMKYLEDPDLIATLVF